VTLRLAEIRDLAYRFVPGVAADPRLYDIGARAYHSWWPAHEIGHFLVATHDECRQLLFGLDFDYRVSRHRRYAIMKELAATSISQRILRRSGHTSLADEEICYTDTDTLECSFEPWCKRACRKLLREHRLVHLPTTADRLERLLVRKAAEVGTTPYPSRRAAEGPTA
jgi:hypothetical protein